MNINPIYYLLIFMPFKNSSGLPWWSSSWESALPLEGAQVQSLIGELGSCMPRGVAKKKKKSSSIPMFGSHLKRKNALQSCLFPSCDLLRQILLSERCHRSRWIHTGLYPLSNLFDMYISSLKTIHYNKIKHYTINLCAFQNVALAFSIFFTISAFGCYKCSPQKKGDSWL